MIIPIESWWHSRTKTHLSYVEWSIMRRKIQVKCLYTCSVLVKTLNRTSSFRSLFCCTNIASLLYTIPQAVLISNIKIAWIKPFTCHGLGRVMLSEYYGISQALWSVFHQFGMINDNLWSCYIHEIYRSLVLTHWYFNWEWITCRRDHLGYSQWITWTSMKLLSNSNKDMHNIKNTCMQCSTCKSFKHMCYVTYRGNPHAFY